MTKCENDDNNKDDNDSDVQNSRVPASPLVRCLYVARVDVKPNNSNSESNEKNNSNKYCNGGDGYF